MIFKLSSFQAKAFFVEIMKKQGLLISLLVLMKAADASVFIKNTVKAEKEDN